MQLPKTHILDIKSSAIMTLLFYKNISILNQEIKLEN